MIEDVRIETDALGFPVVAWRERRGFALERIECRIMKGATGELLFVARGPVRLGAFEEGRPWRDLEGLAVKKAAELYHSGSEQAVRRHFDSKGPALAAAMRDDGKVILATFRSGPPIHINCAEVSDAEAQRLHGFLSQAFLDGAHLGAACNWRVRPDEAGIETYDPQRTSWPADGARRSVRDRLAAGVANIVMGGAAVGLLALLVYLVLVMLGQVSL